jgi:succinate dehydrogenase / fumarate reductase, cytochrome b subunit
MSKSNPTGKTGVAALNGPLDNPNTSLIRREQLRFGHVKQWLGVTLSRKNLMALTGLFLCLFLAVHLFGNLQLLLPVKVAQWQFNFYSKLLSENLFIEFISYALFASILAHVLYALLITIRNRKANGKRYEYDRRGASSKWYSRKMGLLGTIVLVFLRYRTTLPAS